MIEIIGFIATASFAGFIICMLITLAFVAIEVDNDLVVDCGVGLTIGCLLLYLVITLVIKLFGIIV